MNGKKITRELKEKYPTLEIDWNQARSQVNVYGFHTLENAQAARTEMEEIGFELGPNGGQLKIEKIEILLETTKRDAAWLQMTPEQRRDYIANSDTALAHTNAQLRYESGALSDEAIKKEMWQPRYKAALDYINNK